MHKITQVWATECVPNFAPMCMDWCMDTLCCNCMHTPLPPQCERPPMWWWDNRDIDAWYAFQVQQNVSWRREGGLYGMKLWYMLCPPGGTRFNEMYMHFMPSNCGELLVKGGVTGDGHGIHLQHNISIHQSIIIGAKVGQHLIAHTCVLLCMWAHQLSVFESPTFCFYCFRPPHFSSWMMLERE